MITSSLLLTALRYHSRPPAPPEDISCAGACRPIRQPLSIWCPNGKLITPFGDETWWRYLVQDCRAIHLSVAPQVVKATRITVRATSPGTVLRDVVHSAGQSSQVGPPTPGFRSLKYGTAGNIRQHTGAGERIVSRLPRPAGARRQRQTGADGSDLKARQIEWDRHERPGRALHVDEMTCWKM